MPMHKSKPFLFFLTLKDWGETRNAFSLFLIYKKKKKKQKKGFSFSCSDRESRLTSRVCRLILCGIICCREMDDGIFVVVEMDQNENPGEEEEEDYS